MAGRSKTPRPYCVGEKRDGSACNTIPQSAWTHCPYCHDRAVKRITQEWLEGLENGTLEPMSLDGFTIPNLGKPISELTREEKAALGNLIARLDEAA